MVHCYNFVQASSDRHHLCFKGLFCPYYRVKWCQCQLNTEWLLACNFCDFLPCFFILYGAEIIQGATIQVTNWVPYKLTWTFDRIPCSIGT